MAVKYVFNPTTGKLDITSVELPGGSTTQVQFNDAGVFGGDADLTWDKTTNVLGITGDVNLIDGGTYTTTLQTITPTAARTISFPDATGTVALIGGTSGNLIFNNAGAYAGIANSSVDNATGNITLGSRFISSLNGALSATGIVGVPVAATGTWITTGGTATTTKPQVLIEPTGTTSTGWSTAGTGLGVNAASGFTGRLLDLQLNGTSQVVVTGAGNVGIGTASPGSTIDATSASAQLHAGPNAGHGLVVSCTDSTFSRSAIVDNSGFAAGINLYVNNNGEYAGVHIGTTGVHTVRSTRSSTAFDFRSAGAVTLSSNNTERLALDTTGSVRVVTALTVATLPGTPAVGMIARVTDATAPAVGAIVAGGGAAAALVWYNGTNWRVIGV